MESSLTDIVRLSTRYIPERQLPDKAVSLLDTVCARVNLSQSATPPCFEHVPLCVFECEYVPSLHLAVAPVASLLTECSAEVLAVAAGFAGAAGSAAFDVDLAGAASVLAAAPSFLIPPWCEHAPFPPCGAVVPSVQVTGPDVSAAAADRATLAASTAAAIATVNLFITWIPSWLTRVVSPEYRVGRLFRDAKVLQIVEGPNDLHRAIVGEIALGLRSDGEGRR